MRNLTKALLIAGFFALVMSAAAHAQQRCVDYGFRVAWDDDQSATSRYRVIGPDTVDQRTAHQAVDTSIEVAMNRIQTPADTVLIGFLIRGFCQEWATIGSGGTDTIVVTLPPDTVIVTDTVFVTEPPPDDGFAVKPTILMISHDPTSGDGAMCSGPTRVGVRVVFDPTPNDSIAVRTSRSDRSVRFARPSEWMQQWCQDFPPETGEGRDAGCVFQTTAFRGEDTEAAAFDWCTLTGHFSGGGGTEPTFTLTTLPANVDVTATHPDSTPDGSEEQEVVAVFDFSDDGRPYACSWDAGADWIEVITLASGVQVRANGATRPGPCHVDWDIPTCTDVNEQELIIEATSEVVRCGDPPKRGDSWVTFRGLYVGGGDGGD